MITMAKNSISDRFRVTKTGKVLHRPRGVGQCKAKTRGAITRAKRQQSQLGGSDAKIIKQFM